MSDFFEIEIDGKSRDVKVEETSVKRVTIDNKVFVVPDEVAIFIDELASEIKRQQTQRIATDEILDKRINKRAGRIVNALAKAHMLRYPLDKETPLPEGVECDSVNTFQDDVLSVIRHGLQTGTDLKDDLFNTTKQDY